MWNESSKTVRVLLVEDTSPLRRAFGRMLRLNGFEVLETHDGREALNRIDDFRPDLVVTDLMMPIMDGVELIRRLHQDPRTEALPVLAITADPSGELEKRARQAGAAGFLAKPVDLHSLLDELHSFRVRDPRPAENVPPPDPL